MNDTNLADIRIGGGSDYTVFLKLCRPADLPTRIWNYRFNESFEKYDWVTAAGDDSVSLVGEGFDRADPGALDPKRITVSG